jgi:hypothetical protein
MKDNVFWKEQKILIIRVELLILCIINVNLI